MKKNAKKIISAMLILMLALQVLPLSAFIAKASETTGSKEPIYTDADLMYVYYNDISTYRTDKSYPEEEGYVFGGWWTGVEEAEKDANAEPLSETDDSDSAWAKYVPEDVLTVKAEGKGMASINFCYDYHSDTVISACRKFWKNNNKDTIVKK